MSGSRVDLLRQHPDPGHVTRSPRRPRRSRAVLTLAVAAGLVAVGVGPANADRVERVDRTGDLTGFTESSEGVTTAPAPRHRAGDVTTAVVRHGRHAVKVRFSVARLRRADFNSQSGRLRTDTVTRHYFVEDEQGARPRLYVVNRRFQPVCRRATLDVDYRADKVVIRVPRRCLQRPDWVNATALSANAPGTGTNTFFIDDAFSDTPIDDEFREAWSGRVHR